MTSSRMSQTSPCIWSTCRLAALMFWTIFRSTSRLLMTGLKRPSAVRSGRPRRDDRYGLEDDPLGFVLRGDERRDDLQALDRALLLLALAGADLLAQARGLVVEVQVLQQVADRLRSHAAAEVDAEAVRRP